MTIGNSNKSQKTPRLDDKPNIKNELKFYLLTCGSSKNLVVFYRIKIEDFIVRISDACVHSVQIAFEFLYGITKCIFQIPNYFRVIFTGKRRGLLV